MQCPFPSRLALCLLLVCFAVRADTLKITSTPAGATVELDGVVVGVTPFETKFPGGYFHKTKTVVGSRLEHHLIVRISLQGYASREIRLTEGPMQWLDLRGRSHGEYYLLKRAKFDARLDPIASTFTGVFAKNSDRGSTGVIPTLSDQEIARRTKPAVVYLKAFNHSGTGFFVTNTGVIATNAHVTAGEESLLAILPSGDQFNADVVYVDDKLDIALAKIHSPPPNFEVPSIPLAEANTVQQGEPVLAVGCPGDGIEFSYTKGIVSAVGKSRSWKRHMDSN
jgi:serine protease Do